MPYQFLRLLMLCLVIALQAMTPFVHAHADPAQVSHAGWLHGHASMPGDAAYHLSENREQDAEIEMTQGLPQRQAALFLADVDASYPLPVGSPRAMTAGGQDPAWLAASPLHARLSDHALPHTLAPPRC